MKRFIHKLSTTLLIFTLLTNQVAPTFTYAQEVSEPTTVVTSSTETTETSTAEVSVVSVLLVSTVVGSLTSCAYVNVGAT